MLNLSDWACLQELPSTIQSLHLLETLDLRGCSDLKSLPHEVGDLVALASLDLTMCANLQNIPAAVKHHKNARSWKFPDATGELVGVEPAAAAALIGGDEEPDHMPAPEAELRRAAQDEHGNTQTSLAISHPQIADASDRRVNPKGVAPPYADNFPEHGSLQALQASALRTSGHNNVISLVEPLIDMVFFDAAEEPGMVEYRHDATGNQDETEPIFASLAEMKVLLKGDQDHLHAEGAKDTSSSC